LFRAEEETMKDQACFEYTAVMSGTSHEPAGGGALVHGLVELRVMTAPGHPRNQAEMEAEVGDLILFTVHPGPYRCMSRSRVWPVDPGRLARLGKAPKVHRVGGSTIHLYAS
jgi:hypothetical protein